MFLSKTGKIDNVNTGSLKVPGPQEYKISRDVGSSHLEYKRVDEQRTQRLTALRDNYQTFQR